MKSLKPFAKKIEQYLAEAEGRQPTPPNQGLFTVELFDEGPKNIEYAFNYQKGGIVSVLPHLSDSLDFIDRLQEGSTRGHLPGPLDGEVQVREPDGQL